MCFRETCIKDIVDNYNDNHDLTCQSPINGPSRFIQVFAATDTDVINISAYIYSSRLFSQDKYQGVTICYHIIPQVCKNWGGHKECLSV